MKPITVILLVLAGSLLLLVGAFAVYFARGGQVLVWASVEKLGGGGSIEADDNVAEQIAKMDFTFSPTPNLNVHFKGLGHKHWEPPFRDHFNKESMVFCDISVTGKALRAIPSGNEFYDITPEECQRQLIREIQSRLSEEAELQYTMDLFDWQTMPKKQ